MMTTVIRSALALAFCCGALALPPGRADAAPFKKKTEVSGHYFMGVQTLAEFDYWFDLTDGSAPWLRFVFARDGSVAVSDDSGETVTGEYTRFGPRNSRITVELTAETNPFGVDITYELFRIGNTDDWWGEVWIDGVVMGVFRGEQQ